MKTRRSAVSQKPVVGNAELWNSNAALSHLLEDIRAVVWTTDREFRFTSINGAMLAELGASADNVIGRSVLDVHLPGTSGGLAYERALHGKRVKYDEGFAGRFFTIYIEPLLGPDGSTVGCFGAAVDITEDKERLTKVLRMSRIHTVLNGINALTVRIRDRNELFREVCRVAVNQGGFVLAWAGMLEGDQVRPVAYYGDGSYLDTVQFTINADPLAAGNPVAEAIRENRIVVRNDLEKDSVTNPVLKAVFDSGCRSLLVQPLAVGEKVVACLVLNSSEPDFFDGEEIKLLRILTGNISYALEFIAREERLDYLAYYDPLTGLANRRLFSERLGQMVQAARQDKKSLAVLILDLERFKSINDGLGIAGGDEALRVASQRLLQFAGSPNNLARLGGDRFVAVIPNLENAEDLAVILPDKIWKPLGEPLEIGGRELRLTTRIGISIFPDDADTADALIGNAEAAMKRAKASGDRYLFYTQHMGQAIAERMGLDARLRKALELGEFQLHYQPKVDLRSGTICGVEALMRWNSPELGMVPPLRFISLLEETGLILEVGAWALHQAVKDHQAWLDQSLAAPRVAVNVSALQLNQPGFVATVKTAVAAGNKTGRPGIDLEVTESMLMTDVDSSIRKLREIRDMGIEISMDDFGTGYSSLSYLAKLPINTVKIDRSFIVVMTESAERMSIVSTIISLAHSMNMKVIAEGVDSQEQLKFLRLLKCDEIQGYLFSKPLPADELARLLQEGRRLD